MSVLTASTQSPAAARVIATYAEVMEELKAQMAQGGRETPRSEALASRLSAEVRVAAPELLDIVRTGAREPAEAAAYALRYAPEPEAAVGALLDALARFNGGLVNNAALALQYLCITHPTLQLPLEPLARTLHTTEWTSQQKTAQLIEVLANRGELRDATGELTSALIPMLASQRMRVFEPARTLLPAITGQRLGNEPDPWARWFERTYGRSIDLAGGVYELAQIVRLAMVNGTPSFTIEGERIATASAVVSRLQRDGRQVRALNRRFAVVLQVPPNGVPQDDLYALVDRLMKALGPPFDLVVSPMSDTFVPLSVALRNLQGWQRTRG